MDGERYQEKKQRLKKALDAAAPEEKKNLEEELAALEEYYTWLQEATRWEVFPNTILHYKELIPYLCAAGENTLLMNVFKAAETLADRYDDGQLTSQEYLKELERIYRMRSAE